MLAGSAKAIASGYFRNMYVVDSAGMLFRAASAAPSQDRARVEGPFGALTKVDVVFEAPWPADLEILVADLCEIIERDSDDLYDDREKLVQALRGARSAMEVVALLTA
jgi:hypothetical protein